MIKFVQKGDFSKTIRFLGFLYNREFLKNLDSHGEEGVRALVSATPIDSGKTADSWYYKIYTYPNRVKIVWCNSNVTEEAPIAILIQYGHATKDGYYIQGQDYINPAIKPVFDNIAEDIWKEVTNA